MRAIMAIALETFRRLNRDRIFIPVAFIGTLLIGFSGVASYWGVEEFFSILYDFGSTSFHFTGIIIAIFWGNKLIHDTKQEGSIEVQLAAPISRHQWILGKYIGLVLTLVLLSCTLLVAWQAVYIAYQMGPIPYNAIYIFSLLTLSWLVVGAVSIFFASISSQALALFMTLSCVVIGFVNRPIYETLSEKTPEETKAVIELLTGIWDLHYFNLHSYGYTEVPITINLIFSRCSYGVGLCLVLIGLTILNFQNSDITQKS